MSDPAGEPLESSREDPAPDEPSPVPARPVPLDRERIEMLEQLAAQRLRDLEASRIQFEALSSTTAAIERTVVERTAELEASREQFCALVEATHTVPWQFDPVAGRFTSVGPEVEGLLGCPSVEWERPGFLEGRVRPEDLAHARAAFACRGDSSRSYEAEVQLRHDDGRWVWVRTVGSAIRQGRATSRLWHSSTGEMPAPGASTRGVMFDTSERRALELELHHAQKLEAVGRLASGIAHEINTPVQFVSDNVYFVKDAFRDLASLLETYRSGLRAAVERGGLRPETLSELEQAERDADLAYALENAPRALERSIEGLTRIATLVRSMKEFAHPDEKTKVPSDLNRAFSTTLTIARNEFKYVAELETDFGELPPVLCHVSELNQVFLNVVVNAAHAIREVVQGTDRKGVIRIRTRREGGDVVISVSDTGCGIPPEIRSHIFEPFFTTKRVGEGTGQGLAIARSVVVDKHGGQLTFESEVGRGTTFHIRIPIAEPPPRVEAGFAKDLVAREP